MEKVLIADMTSPEFKKAAAKSGAVIIPLGSLEQLGQHGPLGTDWFVASDISAILGERTETLVAPAVPFGDTLELDFWPGTVCIDSDILTSFYYSIAKSFLKHGIKKVIFLNCHSLNLRSADAACRTLHTEGFSTCIIDWWKVAFQVSDKIIDSALSENGHGGETITSVIMALRSSLVDVTNGANERPKKALAYYGKHSLNSGSAFRVYADFRKYCKSGAWGDTSLSTEEKGKLIIHESLYKIAEFIREFKSIK